MYTALRVHPAERRKLERGRGSLEELENCDKLALVIVSLLFIVDCRELQMRMKRRFSNRLQSLATAAIGHELGEERRSPCCCESEL